MALKIKIIKPIILATDAVSFLNLCAFQINKIEIFANQLSIRMSLVQITKKKVGIFICIACLWNLYLIVRKLQVGLLHNFRMDIERWVLAFVLINKNQKHFNKTNPN